MATSIVSSFVQLRVDLALEGLADRHTRFGFDLISLSLFDKLVHFCLRGRDTVTDVIHSRLICNGIANANTEAVVKQPVVHDHLKAAEECAARFRPLFAEDDVDETSLSRSDDGLSDDAVENFAVFNQHAVVGNRVWCGGFRFADNVDARGDR